MEKTQKTKECVSCAITATTHLLSDFAKETAKTERDKLTQEEKDREGGDREREKEGMIKRIAAIMMRRLTGRTLSLSSLLSSMSKPL